MIVYQTDPDGYFLWPTQATLDPEETKARGSEVWAIPGGCVETAPPEPEVGCRLRLVAGGWINEPLPELPPAPEPPPPEAAPLSAAERLAAFLRGNPDVLALIEA